MSEHVKAHFRVAKQKMPRPIDLALFFHIHIYSLDNLETVSKQIRQFSRGDVHRPR